MTAAAGHAGGSSWFQRYLLPGFAFKAVVIGGGYPHIEEQALPSDFLMQQLNMPVFHIIFQLMIFSALLESGTGGVHAINERIAQAYRAQRHQDLPKAARLAIAGVLLVVSIFLADRFGLVTLIAQGYRALAYAILAVYVVPLLTYGVWCLWKRRELAQVAA